MDMITVTDDLGTQRAIPVVAALGPDGKPMELVGDLAPEDCDHAGATWSDCIALRCPRCGSRLFLPPRLLARRPEHEIEAMYALWVRAGCPEFWNGQWSFAPAHQTMLPLPLFAALGGLPVRNDRLDSFAAECVMHTAIDDCRNATHIEAAK
jgi:hypothetical protein